MIIVSQLRYNSKIPRAGQERLTKAAPWKYLRLRAEATGPLPACPKVRRQALPAEVCVAEEVAADGAAGNRHAYEVNRSAWFGRLCLDAGGIAEPSQKVRQDEGRTANFEEPC
jgi:hypothetical protein